MQKEINCKTPQTYCRSNVAETQKLQPLRPFQLWRKKDKERDKLQPQPPFQCREQSAHSIQILQPNSVPMRGGRRRILTDILQRHAPPCRALAPALLWPIEHQILSGTRRPSLTKALILEDTECLGVALHLHKDKNHGVEQKNFGGNGCHVRIMFCFNECVASLCITATSENTLSFLRLTLEAHARPLGSIRPHCAHMSHTVQLTSKTYTFRSCPSCEGSLGDLPYSTLSRAAKALHFQGKPNHPILQTVQPLLLLPCNFQAFLRRALFLESFLASTQTGQALFECLLPQGPPASTPFIFQKQHVIMKCFGEAHTEGE